jgi:hypothetical protein
MLILGGIAAVLVGAALVAAVARMRGWGPAWAAGVRHAFREAGYRSAGAWAEFSDWMRFGRS